MLHLSQFKSPTNKHNLSRFLFSLFVLVIAMFSMTNPATAQKNGDVVILKSRHPSNNYIKLQNGVVKSGSISNNIKSGLWVYELVPNTYHFRLKKAGTTNQYLIADNGKLVCKTVAPTTASSYWKRTSTDKFGYYRIQNGNDKSAYINSKGGPLKATKVSSDSYTSHWTFKPRDKSGKSYADYYAKPADKPKSTPVKQPKVVPVQPTAPVMPPAVLGDVVTVDGNNDRVITNYEPKTDRYTVTFSFEVNPNITWWKAVKIYNEDGDLVCMLSTQDQDKGPKYSKKFSTLSIGRKLKIEYWKAKAFGVHTHVGTEYIDNATLKDYNISFEWQND